MKLRLFILSFALCALLLGCHKPDDKAPELPLSPLHDTLVGIDSLLQTDYTVALERIEPFTDSLDTENLTDFDINYALLMKSEALWKSPRMEEIDFDAVALTTAYFDSLAPAFPKNYDLAYLQARAHFIYSRKGMTDDHASVKDDSLFRCKQLYLALETMENHFADEQLTWHKARFTAKTAEELSLDYSLRFLTEPATYFQKKALALNKKVKPRSKVVASNLFLLGYEFDITEQIDSASHYYDLSLELLTDTTLNLYYLLKDRQAIGLYKLNHDGDTSIKILKSILMYGPEIMKQDLFATIGWIYQEERQYDSALAYLNPIYDDAPSRLKSEISDYLIKVYEALGDTVKMHEHMHYLALHPIFNPKKIQEDADFTRMFNDYLQQREAHERLAKQNEIRQQRNKTLVSLAAFIVLAALAAWLLHKRKMKKQSDEASQQMQAEREAHRLEKASMSGRLKRSNEELRELKDQIRQQNHAAPKPETQAASFTEEPICRQIMKRVSEGQFKSKVSYLDYSDYALSKEQITALREAADRHFGQFTIRLAKAYPDLTKSDLNYCCLYLLDLNDADIAALMQRAYNTVSDRSRKLKTLFGSEEPLSTILRGLATEEQFC